MTTPITYPLDITGSSSTNLVTNEEHNVVEFPYMNSYLIMPDFSPFFSNSLIVGYSDGVNPNRQLVLGTDYTLALSYWGASRSIGLPVCGAILLSPNIVSGTIGLQYQTLGGPWEANREEVLNNIMALDGDPRNVIWDVLSDVTNCFPSTNNSMVVNTSSGLQQLIESIDNLAVTIANKPPTEVIINKTPVIS